MKLLYYNIGRTDFNAYHFYFRIPTNSKITCIILMKTSTKTNSLTNEFKHEFRKKKCRQNRKTLMPAIILKIQSKQ